MIFNYFDPAVHVTDRMPECRACGSLSVISYQIGDLPITYVCQRCGELWSVDCED